MNTHKQLNETLLPSLELTGIKNDEYLIVGSASEKGNLDPLEQNYFRNGKHLEVISHAKN